jgi:hypothetical protein
MLENVSDPRDHGIDFRRHGLDGGPAHGLQHLGDAERAYQRRQEPDAAGEVGAAESEALIIIVGLLPDGGDPQPEEARKIALERVASGQSAGDDDAKQRNPKELEALELQRHLAQHGREGGDAQCAEQGAEPRSGGGDAHGAAGEALPRQRVPVERRAGGSWRAGNVQEDGATAAAVDGSHIDANQHEDSVSVRHGESERRHQGDAHGRRQSRQGADDDAEEGRPQDGEKHYW